MKRFGKAVLGGGRRIAQGVNKIEQSVAIFHIPGPIAPTNGDVDVVRDGVA
jgi:hypothetical protein